MLLLAALQLNILKRAKNHHLPNTEINNRVGDGTVGPMSNCTVPSTLLKPETTPSGKTDHLTAYGKRHRL